MASRSKQTGKVNRRSDILRAAEKLMHSRGLSGVTTRQISQAVGCSEGALYVHFKGRLELLLAMLEESLPKMLRPLQTLQESVGQGSAQGNLTQAVEGIFKFHVLAEYIGSEQRLGRIDSRADADLAANLIMSSSFFRAFVQQFFGTSMHPAWREFAKELIATVAPAPARE